MLRLSSYGGGSSTSPVPASSPSLSSSSTPVVRPTVPYADEGQGPSPHVLLIQRSHELRRVALNLAQWFTNLAALHHSHSLALGKLEPLQVPFKEKQLFIPVHSTDNAEEEGGAQLGGTGHEGWQDLFSQTNSTHSRLAAHHAQLAKSLSSQVIAPLNKLALELKTHIQLLEKEFKNPTDQVARERDLVAPLYTRLANAIALVEQKQSADLSASTSSKGGKAPKPLSPQDDPVLLRAQIEALVRVQLEKENDLLALVKKWTSRCYERELAAFDQVKQAYSNWESLHSSLLLESQQLGMFLAATVDAVPNDKEWGFFATAEDGLKATIAEETPERTVKDVEWVGKGHELTTVVKEGLLERQTSILKSWKPAYFILTPAGILHIYGPPPASVVLPTTPSGDANDADETSRTAALALAPLSPIAHYLALHSSPHLSLNLSHCFLGPMPTPSPALPPPPEGTSTPLAAAKGKKNPALDAVFTLIEGTVSNGGREVSMSTGGGTRHVVRCKGEEGWEEMGGWVAEIGKFCAVPSVPPPPSPPTPTPPVLAPTPVDVADDSPTAALAAAEPSTVLARSLPPPPPALPERTGSAFTLSGHGPPPALPPRDSFLSQASSSSGVTGDGEEDLSMMSEGQSYGDLSHAMASFGLVGVGAGAGVGAAKSLREDDTPATTVHEGDTDVETPAKDAAKKDEEDDSDGEGDESGDDLGRSVPADDEEEEEDEPAAESHSNESSSKVKNLAAAWEKHGAEDGDNEKNEGEKTPAEEGGLAVPKGGKKGKKKRKSKGKAGTSPSGEKALPSPSIDPESSDLGMPAPQHHDGSPTFESAPSSPKFATPPEPEGEVEEVKPPMELEEVQEAPDQEPQQAQEQEGGEVASQEEQEHHPEGEQQHQG
ncbi:hypothetical protein JCM10908_000833 [Rhodotorula pacifica]|uniref:uncharacterized protein n=1 Tax=Rhodotorula pacifica TaxID=1495444 RepID=UPI00316EA526